MRHVRRALAAAAAAAGTGAALIFTATPAQADACLEGAFESACFTSYGDYFDFWVEDSGIPGAEPSIIWRTSYGRTGECRSEYSDHHTVCNYDMRENHTVYFKICSYNGDVIACTREASSPT